MENPKSLNVDISKSIAELRSAIQHFELKKILYRTLIKVKGLEFDGYRDLNPDDDATSIDWKASVRAGRTLARKYREEKNQKIVFVIDTSENMVFGSSSKLKCEYAAGVAGAFAHLIMNDGDRVGFILFNNKVSKFTLPSRGTKHFSRFISDITNPENYFGASNLSEALNYIVSYIPRSVISVIIVSDFLSFNDQCKNNFALIANKFDTMALMVKDPLDKTLPAVSGELVIEDPKTGQQIVVNPLLAKKIYEQNSIKQENDFKEICIENNVDLLQLMTNEHFVPSLVNFLKRRTTKRGAR